MFNIFSFDALAQGAESSSASPIVSFIPLILIFVIFYFLLIRPHNKKIKSHKNMIESICKGDKIINSGGIIGVVTKVDLNNSTLSVTVSQGVDIKITINSVSEILNKNRKNREEKVEKDKNREDKNKEDLDVSKDFENKSNSNDLDNNDDQKSENKTKEGSK